MTTPITLSAEVLAPIKVLFFQECEELLADMETGLLAMQSGEADAETVNSVFRAVHSIKGSGGAFGLDALVAFAHAFESVMAALRAGRLQADAGLVALLLRAADGIADLVRFGREDQPVPQGHVAEIAVALEQVVASVEAQDEVPQNSAADDDLFDFTPRPVNLPLIAPPAGKREWTIQLRPDPLFYAKGGEVLPLLRELRRLGDVRAMIDDRDLPLLQDFDPERAYLAWTVSLTTESSEEDVREIFAFAQGDCDLSLIRQDDWANAAPAPVAVAPAAAAPAKAAPAPAALGETLRVDRDRIDRLVNLVGELLMQQTVISQQMKDLGLAAAASAESPLDQMDRLCRTLQDRVMALRTQPVKVVFQRMPRLVRELEITTGKQIDLTVHGEATEVDRTVIERLIDPLTHMVRNAIDHGVETPEQRLAAGKPARGSLRLSAAHRNGRVVVEVADDGAGIDRERLRSKAIERGLIAPGAQLSGEELDALIFAPGFSTAAAVSDVSGRGVGMDVVKSGVEALGGRISFTSAVGEGSTFTLSLPLTLAVLDGMAVSIGEHRLVVPLTALVEVSKPASQDVRALGPGARLLAYRGGHVPLIDLARHLGFRDGPSSPESGVVLVVEDDRGQRAALLVDEIHGQRQVVIRSLTENYQSVEGIAAAAIASDGQIVLVIDVHAILAPQRREPMLEAS